MPAIRSCPSAPPASAAPPPDPAVVCLGRLGDRLPLALQAVRKARRLHSPELALWLVSDRLPPDGVPGRDGLVHCPPVAALRLVRGMREAGRLLAPGGWALPPDAFLCALAAGAPPQTMNYRSQDASVMPRLPAEGDAFLVLRWPLAVRPGRTADSPGTRTARPGPPAAGWLPRRAG